jgi:hypothetical protein
MKLISSRQLVRVACVFLAAALLTHVLAAQSGNRKLAQTGMKFLSIGTSARMTAMAEAFTALEGSSMSMFYNPAGMASVGGDGDASLGQTQWIADIKHYYGTVALNASNDIGVFGLSVQYVDYGVIQSTIRANNSEGFLDVGTIHPSGLSIGVGYARSLTNKFSIGGNIKFVNQYLGESIMGATIIKDVSGNDSAYIPSSTTSNFLDLLAFDFGVLYKTGYKSLTFGMVIRNFSREGSFQKETFQLPLTFKVGLAMNVLDFTNLNHEMHALNVDIDAEHPRDYPEQVRIGAEYIFNGMVALRVGYVSPSDQNTIMYGFGLQQAFGSTKVGIDYSYVPFKDFDGVSRVSFRFAF